MSEWDDLLDITEPKGKDQQKQARAEAIDLLEVLLGLIEETHTVDYRGAVKTAIRSLRAWDRVIEDIALTDYKPGSYEALDIIDRHLSEVTE